MEEKSTLFKVLSIFEELYPLWVSGLKKDQVKKKSVCAGYRRILTPDITNDHLLLLDQYLKSALNTEYRKWPPEPLELLRLLDMSKKKAQSALNTSHSPVLSPTDHQETVAYWLALVGMGKKTLGQVPEQIKHYLDTYRAWQKHPDHAKFCEFYLLFRQLVDQVKNLTVSQIFEKMLSAEKSAWLEMQIGKINSSDLIQYLVETRIDEEIYEYLINKGTAS